VKFLVDRTVLTADLDYPRLLALAATAQPGLILFGGGDWSEADVIARLREALGALEEDYLAHSVIVVERGRVRRRGLPIRAPDLVKKPPST
jgi:predicted nuclease of predicted toxin-antitoxin system